jgi:hypothetical protein
MLAYRLLCGDHPPLVAAVEVNGSLEHDCDPSSACPTCSPSTARRTAASTSRPVTTSTTCACRRARSPPPSRR